MKTITSLRLEKLLDETIKSKLTKRGTLYLDILKNNEFAVSLDDFNKGIFSDIRKANQYYNQLSQEYK